MRRKTAIEIAREATGVGLQLIRRGMELAGTSDALLGACYITAPSQCRWTSEANHRYKLDWAVGLAAQIRAEHPDLYAREEGGARAQPRDHHCAT